MLYRTGLRIMLANGAAVMSLQAAPVLAQSAGQLQSIQAQIRALNEQLARVKRDIATKDAQIKAARDAADKARVTAEQTQATVATLPPPTGFTPGNGRGNEQLLLLGIGPAHPDYKPPKSDWTSLNIIAPNAGAQNAGQTGPGGTFHVGGLTIQLGGFIEAAALYRTRNEVTDLASNFSTGIPLPQSPQYHEGELRGSARQSRFTILVHGDVSEQQHVSGYAEFDLQGAAPTANSNESNSYNPRVRQAYVAYDDDSSGVHALGGQAWSLATLFKVGVTPRQEDLPLTIDQQYVPGFTWTRQTQFRVAKSFAQEKYWLAASVESPQTVFAVGSAGAGTAGGTVNTSNPGISSLTVGQAYSSNYAPDVIVKAAADPGYGHYEIYGLGRFLTDRTSVVGDGRNNTRFAGGVGGGTILPIVGSALSFEARALAGYGIGRYGTSQLSDATVNRDGSPAALPEVQALVGLVGHPKPWIDLYTYVGTEQIGRKYFSSGGQNFGYGNPLYSNAGCGIELSTATCTANTSGVTQGTLGGYWRFLQGDFGTLQAGAQYSYTRRDVYRGVAGVGGTGNNSTDDNIVFISLRYLPFQ